MFGIGMQEMIVILVVALIFIGPKKLPDIAKGLGRAFNEFKKATNDFKESMGMDDELGDVKRAFNDMNKDIKETIDLKPSQKMDSSPAPDSASQIKEPENIDTDNSTDAK